MDHTATEPPHIDASLDPIRAAICVGSTGVGVDAVVLPDLRRGA